MGAVLPIQFAHRKAQTDPLSRFRFQCKGQRDAVDYFFQAVETHARAANASGKTTSAVAACLSLAQGREELGGLKVPTLSQPSTGWVITQSRRQQVDASQAAFIRWLGDWPYEIGWAAKALDYAEVIRVKPMGWHSDDPNTWSRIVFQCVGDGLSFPGGRIHWAMGDECPPKEVWDEVRARGISNEPFYKIIAETPVDKRLWWWLKESDAGFVGCLNRPLRNRVEVTWSLKDVACHSEEHLQGLIEGWLGSPLFEARVNGDYVDVEAACPFDWKALERWLARCTPPKLEERTRLFQAAQDDAEAEMLHAQATVQVWEDPDRAERYQMIVDPSGGIDDARHDPEGFHIHAMRQPRLVARHSGRLDPYSLGVLCSIWGKRYGQARIDIEANKYADGCFAALRRRRYSNLGRPERMRNPGSGNEYGFYLSEQARWQAMAAIQDELQRERAGESAFEVRSEDVVRCLMNTVVDEKGKWLAAPGRHDEDLILLGWGLSRIKSPGVAIGAHREKLPEGLPATLAELLRRESRSQRRTRRVVGPPERFSR